MTQPASVLLARNVRVERVRRGWKQSDLAEALGWSTARVTAVESGGRQLNVDAVIELCRAFEVPLVKLLEDVNPADLDALGVRPG
jgi:transcriptional regulator with XRE-family HTH domain